MVQTAPIDSPIECLRRRLLELDRVLVAFSGGADSAFLAWMAHDTLGPDRALAVTAVSPSLAADEAADCAALAEEWGLRWQAVTTDELDRPEYVANDTDRCAHCKAELMDVIGPLGAAESATVVLGTNLDDLGDHRPGQGAAASRGAAFPLVDAGFTKAAVREASRSLGLRTWDKPAAACLASRVPYGTPVTFATLDRVARAEAALRRSGSASSGSATTATWPAWRSSSRTWPGSSSVAQRSSTRSRPPATPGSPSTSRASARGT